MIIIIVLLLIAGTIVVVILTRGDFDKTVDNSDKPVDNSDKPVVGYETSSDKNNDVPVLDYDNSAVALDEEDLEKQFQELQDKVNEGQVSLEFQNAAFSENGTDFTCYLANSSSNTEDMFFNIYTDGTFTEQIYLSGLLSPGSVITSFKSDVKFKPGNYEVIVLFTTVSDDHKTMTSQTPVAITLKVD